MDLSNSWVKWMVFFEGKQAEAELEESIRKMFVRIDNAFSQSFARYILQQWHLMSSQKLAAEYRSKAVSFESWCVHKHRMSSFRKIGTAIMSNSTNHSKAGAFSCILWESLQFKSSYRERVMTSFERMRQRRLVGRCVLNWFYTVRSACEEEAHMEEEHQIARSKALAQYLNEWRVVAVRQKDLRESASTIAEQWEREITLKRKLASEQPTTPQFPATQSPNSTQQSIETSGMWSDMPILTNKQQTPSDLGSFGFNDPIQPFGPSTGAPLGIKSAFAIWKGVRTVKTNVVQTLQGKSAARPKVEIPKVQIPVKTDVLPSRASPRKSLKSPRDGVKVAASRSRSPSPPKASRSPKKIAGNAQDGALFKALGAELRGGPANPRGEAHTCVEDPKSSLVAGSKSKQQVVPSPQASSREHAARSQAAHNSAMESSPEPLAVPVGQVGVGMRIQDDPPHKIISLVPGGPAARSGAIRVGDYLLAISDVEVRGLSAANIRSLIVGPDGSKVSLRFKRASTKGSSAASTPRDAGEPGEEFSVVLFREPAMKGALKAASLQSKSVKELHAMFKKFDTDHSGRIDRVEMKKVLASLGFNASEAEVQRMINQSSPRATIDFNAFLTILGVSPQGSK